MSTARETLKHKLTVLAGLPPGHPTDEELEQIIDDVKAKREPTEADWKAAARRYVRGAGTFGYKSEDMSRINVLLHQIINQGHGGSGPPRSTK